MYKIVRHYYPDFKHKNQWGEPTHKKSRTIKSGLTLEQAQAHCSDPKTRKEGVYFDGYTKEE